MRSTFVPAVAHERMHFKWIFIFDRVVLLHDDHREHSRVHQVLHAVRDRIDGVRPPLGVRLRNGRGLDVDAVQRNGQIAQRQRLVGRQRLGNRHLRLGHSFEGGLGHENRGHEIELTR